MSQDIFGTKSGSEYPPLPYKLHACVIGKERKHGKIVLGTIEQYAILDPKYDKAYANTPTGTRVFYLKIHKPVNEDYFATDKLGKNILETIAICTKEDLIEIVDSKFGKRAKNLDAATIKEAIAAVDAIIANDGKSDPSKAIKHASGTVRHILKSQNDEKEKENEKGNEKVNENNKDKDKGDNSNNNGKDDEKEQESSGKVGKNDKE